VSSAQTDDLQKADLDFLALAKDTCISPQREGWDGMGQRLPTLTKAWLKQNGRGVRHMPSGSCKLGAKKNMEMLVGKEP
jgi:hypothetical protein